MKKLGNVQPSTIGADLQTRVEKLETTVAWILKQLEELRAQRTIGSSGTKDTLDDGTLRDINLKLQNLANDMQSLRNEFAKWLKDI